MDNEFDLMAWYLEISIDEMMKLHKVIDEQ